MGQQASAPKRSSEAEIPLSHVILLPSECTKGFDQGLANCGQSDSTRDDAVSQLHTISDWASSSGTETDGNCNCIAQNARQLSFNDKTKPLERGVIPSFDYRNDARWLPHRQLELLINWLQKKTVVGMQPVVFNPGEAPEDFVQRRNRIISQRCHGAGLWSTRHCKRVLSWRDHPMKPSDPASWASTLYQYRVFDWLVQQRRAHNSNPFVGHSGTRAAAGHVATRWHD